jgi:hypothetical protein
LERSSPFRDYLAAASTVFDLSSESFQFHFEVPAKRHAAQYHAVAAGRSLRAYARLAESMAKLANWPGDCKVFVSNPNQEGSL